MASDEPTDPVPPPAPRSAATSTSEFLPIGAWLWLEPPGLPPVVGFTYLDRQMGFSAQGWRVAGAAGSTEPAELAEPGLDRERHCIVRLSKPDGPWCHPWRQLGEDEVQAFGLEPRPDWVDKFYGTQPPAGSLWGLWRQHPQLQGRFLEGYPDDLQVYVHDGGPRLSPHPPEAVWVMVTGMDGDVFRGLVLNEPYNLKSVRKGSEVQFVRGGGAPHPVMVTEKYLQERGAWVIHPCNQCGLTELFDAPSDLIRVVFPNKPPDAEMSMFTAVCPLCGGVMGAEARSDALSEGGGPAPPAPPVKRPWWRFWG